MRRTPLRQVSAKRRQQQQAYDRAVTLMFLRDNGECQVAKVWPEVDCSGRLDPHHKASQKLFPERRCDLDNLITCCRAHHDALHTHPQLARERGLIRSLGDVA